MRKLTQDQVQYLLTRLRNARDQLRLALGEAEIVKYNKEMVRRLWTLIGKADSLIDALKTWQKPKE